MSLKFSKNISSPIETEIQKELHHYEEALKADAEFHVLKSIREKIRLLEAALKERQKQCTKNGEKQDCRSCCTTFLNLISSF